MTKRFLLPAFLLLTATGISAQSLDTGTVYLPHNSIWNANGKVGINTRNPKAFLDVAAAFTDTTTSVLARLPEGDATGSGTCLSVRAYNTQPINAPSFSIEHNFYGQKNSAITFHRGLAQQGGFMTFSTSNGTEKMRLDANRNLGIGTATTGLYRLTVEGTVAARRILVKQTAWPDFVFADDYQLPTLKATEEYIKTYKHLPEVPTASIIEKNGQDVGEMNKILLQKVEELTLHLIEQDKRIKMLEAAKK